MSSIEEKLKDIRTQCRMAMNGVVSSSMREKGMIYKLNLGLTTQQIQNIADKYGVNKELAERLWVEDGARELKIMATMLYPIDDFTIDVANKWVSEIPNQEIREQLCFNLLQNLPHANQLAVDWSNNENLDVRVTGYWLLSRLFLTRKIKSIIVIDYFSHIWQDIISDDIFLRNASLSVLKHIGRQSKDESKVIMSKIECYNNSMNSLKQEVYNNLSFEFEFYFG